MSSTHDLRLGARLCLMTFLVLAFGMPPELRAESEGEYARARQALMVELDADFRLTESATGLARMDPLVRQAMEKVPRHAFVSSDHRANAYRNQPLPIGYGQTISQPYIVALMTDLLGIAKNAAVLEIGTGSGYQAAVLAELAERVYSIEIIEGLGTEARERLKRLGYANVETRVGDGYYGWEERAPFDGIIVTAAADQIAPPLVQQLKRGGRMVIPVGGHFMTQYLVLVSKDQDGQVTTRQLLPVRFVPLTGAH
ncbi:MAG: protein-L-isoaspartate(D-aspartate) O-methyltransferase [Gammaproteobacteria bacterium]